MIRTAGRLVPLAIALPLAVGGCLERAQPTLANAPVPVQVVRVSQAGSATRHDYSGIIRPRREADLGFRAGGRIVAREVDVGSVVKAGQVLARLDPADLALQVRAAEADLAGAEAQAAQASSDAARSAKLLAAGWVAAQADEIKQATARAAQDKVASARAALNLARNQLGYAVLTAPRDSVVTAVLADPGTVVSQGQPVLHLAESGALEAEVALPETALAGEPGQAQVTLWAHPDQSVAATLRELAPSADPRLRTYTARFALTQPPAWLAIGMSATVSLGSGVGDPALSLVPLASLADRGQGPMVWRVTDAGQLEIRPVQVRQLRRDTALVAGLAAGDQVVAMGAQKLDPAARVRVIDRKTVTE